MISCHEFLGQLPDYLNGQLPPALVPRVSAHLRHCKKCKTVVRSAQETLRVYFNESPKLIVSTIPATR